jgi:hypothetical protein
MTGCRAFVAGQSGSRVVGAAKMTQVSHLEYGVN